MAVALWKLLELLLSHTGVSEVRAAPGAVVRNPSWWLSSTLHILSWVLLAHFFPLI